MSDLTVRGQFARGYERPAAPLGLRLEHRIQRGRLRTFPLERTIHGESIGDTGMLCKGARIASATNGVCLAFLSESSTSPIGSGYASSSLPSKRRGIGTLAVATTLFILGCRDHRVRQAPSLVFYMFNSTVESMHRARN